MKKKNFKRYETGYLFYGDLYPCETTNELVKTGYREVPSLVRDDVNEIIVPVWSVENVDGDNARHFSTAEEFLLVGIKYLPNKKSDDPDKPYVYAATVLGRLGKNNVKPLVSDRVAMESKLLIDY